MKNKFFLVTISLFCVIGAQAQISRLIGLTKTKYNGLNFSTIGDTINYMYTGAMDTSRKGALAYDSSYSMVYGTGYTPGNLSYRYYQTFADTFNIASVTAQSFDTPSNNWVNYQHTTNTYDATNNLTQSVLQVKYPSTGGWLNNTNNTYTYTGANNIIRILQGWNTGSLSWVNREKDSFAYDASNNMTYHLAQTWDTTLLDWVNNNQFFYTYNSANKVILAMRQTWNRSAAIWRNNTNTIYDYNAATLLSNTIVQRWDTTALVWNNSTADSILYFPGGDKSVETTLRWDTTTHAWANINMHTFTYDANHNVLTDTTLNWNNAAAAFIYNKLRINSYNTYNQILVTTTETWNTASSSWIYRLGTGGGPGNASDIQWRYYYELYSAPTDVKGAVIDNGSMVTFPDPANDLLSVKLNWNEATAFTIGIYDMRGSLVRQWSEPAVQSYVRTIPVSDLAPGFYIIKAGNGRQQQTQQFIKN